MKKLFLISYFSFLVSNSFAQNTFLIGQKTYPCTPSFHFDSPNAAFSDGHSLDILIAKNGVLGMLVLSTSLDVLGDCLRIKGNILIYLEDGSVIICLDNGKFDYVDGISSTIYTLTQVEIRQLEKSNIYKIRFSLKDYNNCISAGGQGDFTASNSYRDYEHGSFGGEAKTDVPDLITELFVK